MKAAKVFFGCVCLIGLILFAFTSAQASFKPTSDPITSPLESNIGPTKTLPNYCDANAYDACLGHAEEEKASCRNDAPELAVSVDSLKKCMSTCEKNNQSCYSLCTETYHNNLSFGCEEEKLAGSKQCAEQFCPIYVFDA